MKRLALICALGLAACSPNAPLEPALAVELAAMPTSLKDLEAEHDWQHETGDKLNAAWSEGAKAILGSMSRLDAIKAINEAGFECIYGEAHPDYPDPMAVCTRSFATRACQMDWELASTADRGMVNSLEGSFKRDCVGTDADWPDKSNSPIDSQLAPQTPPPAPN